MDINKSICKIILYYSNLITNEKYDSDKYASYDIGVDKWSEHSWNLLQVVDWKQ